MRIHTENHTTAHVATSAQTAPNVNEVTAPVSAVKLSITPAELSRPRLLLRREARWARRANH